MPYAGDHGFSIEGQIAGGGPHSPAYRRWPIAWDLTRLAPPTWTDQTGRLTIMEVQPFRVVAFVNDRPLKGPAGRERTFRGHKSAADAAVDYAEAL